MYLKLIACNVLLREVCLCAADSPHTLDIEFTEKGSHDDSENLRRILQEKIRQSEDSGKKYDAILLAFGLCGNSTAGLTSALFPLVIPRAHDCCTLFLGSKTRFHELFGENPSLPFSSPGYMERGDSYLQESEFGAKLGIDKTYDEYVALYGEENARYIMETLEPATKYDGNKLVFIEIPQTAQPLLKAKAGEQAEKDGKVFDFVPGDIRLVRNLLHGDWNEEDFCIIGPGQIVT
ncbi:MAG: DUF1638 domain-containing protein, partial [Spirochaetales bacterium]